MRCTDGAVPCRYMFNSDGTFNHGHINNWQHAAMYFAYMVAGIVDMAGVYTDLPPDSEQVPFVAQLPVLAELCSLSRLTGCPQDCAGVSHIPCGFVFGCGHKWSLPYGVYPLTCAGSAGNGIHRRGTAAGIPPQGEREQSRMRHGASGD